MVGGGGGCVVRLGAHGLPGSVSPGAQCRRHAALEEGVGRRRSRKARSGQGGSLFPKDRPAYCQGVLWRSFRGGYVFRVQAPRRRPKAAFGPGEWRRDANGRKPLSMISVCCDWRPPPGVFSPSVGLEFKPPRRLRKIRPLPACAARGFCGAWNPAPRPGGAGVGRRWARFSRAVS